MGLAQAKAQPFTQTIIDNCNFSPSGCLADALNLTPQLHKPNSHFTLTAALSSLNYSSLYQTTLSIIILDFTSSITFNK